MVASTVARISPRAMDVRSFQPIAEENAAVRNEDRLRLLIDTGLLLSSERSLDVIVQAALDAGLALCGAAFGAFFYNRADGQAYELYKTSGIEPDRLATARMPRPSTLFTAPANDPAPVRSDDITADARYPPDGAPDNDGHQRPVRSYLAVPVRSRGGEVLGALLYAHPEAGIFRAEGESLVATVAAQAAVAIENFRLTESLTREIALADAARAEQRSTDRRLRQALDATQLGTWNWSLSTGLIDLDERAGELFGISPHQPTSRNAIRDRLVVPEDLDRTPPDLMQALEEGGKYEAEYRIRLPDGTLRWIAASGIPTLEESTGKLIGLIGTVQDISSRKLQEESLRQSEKLAATGRLAATIAHEINNPLEAVTNLIYLAKTDPAAPPAVQKMLETADGELARVSQIAQQTLGFYRDTTKPVTIDINELLHAVVDLFSRKLAGKRLQVTLDLDPGMSMVGLQGEIRQVVSNLLVNAIDASPSTGAKIRIRGRRRHRDGTRGVAVLIADEGYGIPADVRPRLFSPFVTTKQSRGTGLGLWVTKGMVEKHGGSIRFRSRTDTPSGTIFRVYLPDSSPSHIFASQTASVLQ